MKTIEQLQEPQSLFLAMGELNANELRIAQAAVQFGYFHLTRTEAQALARKVSGWDSHNNYADERYVRETMMGRIA